MGRGEWGKGIKGGKGEGGHVSSPRKVCFCAPVTDLIRKFFVVTSSPTHLFFPVVGRTSFFEIGKEKKRH